MRLTATPFSLIQLVPRNMVRDRALAPVRASQLGCIRMGGYLPCREDKKSTRPSCNGTRSRCSGSAHARRSPSSTRRPPPPLLQVDSFAQWPVEHESSTPPLQKERSWRCGGKNAREGGASGLAGAGERPEHAIAAHQRVICGWRAALAQGRTCPRSGRPV